MSADPAFVDLLSRLGKVSGECDEARAERDRARSAAAALEEECARLATVAQQERARLTAERDEAMARVVELQAELETTLRRLDAARSEIARAASCQVSPQ